MTHWVSVVCLLVLLMSELWLHPPHGLGGETFDVGSDTGTPVDDKDYQVPFALTGKLGKITLDLGESTVSAEIIKRMMEELAQKKDD